MRSRRWSPCVACKAYGNRCSQARPCARCVKIGRNCTNLDDMDRSEGNARQTVVIVAERPMRFQPSLSIGDETMPMIQLPPELLWASIELMKNMAIGHDVAALAHFFASMHISECTELFHAMNRASSLGSRFDPPDLPSQQRDHPGSSSSGMDTDSNDFQYWGMETGTASFRTTFDPASRCRRAIITNARQASFYGVHPEEFQVNVPDHQSPEAQKRPRQIIGHYPRFHAPTSARAAQSARAVEQAAQTRISARIATARPPSRRPRLVFPPPPSPPPPRPGSRRRRSHRDRGIASRSGQTRSHRDRVRPVASRSYRDRVEIASRSGQTDRVEIASRSRRDRVEIASRSHRDRIEIGSDPKTLGKLDNSPCRCGRALTAPPFSRRGDEPLTTAASPRRVGRKEGGRGGTTSEQQRSLLSARHAAVGWGGCRGAGAVRRPAAALPHRRDGRGRAVPLRLRGRALPRGGLGRALHPPAHGRQVRDGGGRERGRERLEGEGGEDSAELFILPPWAAGALGRPAETPAPRPSGSAESAGAASESAGAASESAGAASESTQRRARADRRAGRRRLAAAAQAAGLGARAPGLAHRTAWGLGWEGGERQEGSEGGGRGGPRHK